MAGVLGLAIYLACKNARFCLHSLASCIASVTAKSCTPRSPCDEKRKFIICLYRNININTSARTHTHTYELVKHDKWEMVQPKEITLIYPEITLIYPLKVDVVELWSWIMIINSFAKT